MKRQILKRVFLTLVFSVLVSAQPITAKNEKQTIKALYIPLADHYAALVAYERYGDKMQHADFQLIQMKNWDLLRAYFQSGKQVDMAYIMTPLAIDMFQEKPHFKWIGLMHRDGNALAINELLQQQVKLAKKRTDRKPDDQVAKALKFNYQVNKKPIEIGMPHQLSTHTVILYRYLKEHGVRLSLKSHTDAEVLAITIPPPKSPTFLLSKSNRAQVAAFEQSLPWAEVAEKLNYGNIAWYSKDVMPWKHGHVECIALATNSSIINKTKAVKEVMSFIHQAGADIEQARIAGGEEMAEIVAIIQKHIPAHSSEAIIASLAPDLNVINYTHLNIDKAGLKQIMDYAVEGSILTKTIDIDSFADEQFTIELRE